MLRPMTIDRDRRLAAVHARERARFEERTRRSAELTARARPLMPDGVPMAWMAGLYDHRPVHVAHGEGCRFTDVDGNTYVDFNQADLGASCGFAPPAVVAAVAERAARGMQFLLPVEEGIEAADCSPAATTCPAGSSPCRPPAPTPRRSGSPVTAPGDRSSCFGGHYHGHLDDTLVTGDERHGAPGLLGLNPRAAADTRLVPFNDLDALERVLAREDVAAVDHRAGAHERRRRAARRRLPRGRARGHARARDAARSSTRPTPRRSPTAGSPARGDSSPTSSRWGRASAAGSRSARTG